MGRLIRRHKLQRVKIRYVRFSRRPIERNDELERPQPNRTYFFPPVGFTLDLCINPDFFWSGTRYAVPCPLCSGIHATETIDIGGGMTAETCPNVIKPCREYYDRSVTDNFYGPSPLNDTLDAARYAHESFFGKGIGDLLEAQKIVDAQKAIFEDYLRGQTATRRPDPEFIIIDDIDELREQREKMQPVGDHVHNSRGPNGSCTRCLVRLNP